MLLLTSSKKSVAEPFLENDAFFRRKNKGRRFRLNLDVEKQRASFFVDKAPAAFDFLRKSDFGGGSKSGGFSDSY